MDTITEISFISSFKLNEHDFFLRYKIFFTDENCSRAFHGGSQTALTDGPEKG